MKQSDIDFINRVVADMPDGAESGIFACITCEREKYITKCCYECGRPLCEDCANTCVVQGCAKFFCEYHGIRDAGSKAHVCKKHTEQIYGDRMRGKWDWPVDPLLLDTVTVEAPVVIPDPDPEPVSDEYYDSPPYYPYTGEQY